MGIYYCLHDATLELEFVYPSGKMDILATHGSQKCYFNVSSSALSYIQAFRFVFN